MTKNGISLSSSTSYIVFYIVITLIVILGLSAGRMGFCRYVCWMAPFMIIVTKIRKLFKWPILHLESDKEKCGDCEQCDEICPMSLHVNDMVQKGCMQNTECSLCGACVDVCPEGVIKYGFKDRK